MEIWRRLMLAGALALSAAFGAVPVEVAASEGGVRTGTVTFPVLGTPCLEFADVGFLVCGISGTVDYHLVFTPSGNENSWFKVQNFTGAIFACPNPPFCLPLPSLLLASFTGDSAMVLVHLGPDRPDFILVNHPSAPLPHRVTLP